MYGFPLLMFFLFYFIFLYGWHTSLYCVFLYFFCVRIYFIRVPLWWCVLSHNLTKFSCRIVYTYLWICLYMIVSWVYRDVFPFFLLYIYIFGEYTQFVVENVWKDATVFRVLNFKCTSPFRYSIFEEKNDDDDEERVRGGGVSFGIRE